MEIYEIIEVHVGYTYAMGDEAPETDVHTTLYASLKDARAAFMKLYEEQKEDAYDDAELENIDKGYAYASFATNDFVYLRRAEVIPASAKKSA